MSGIEHSLAPKNHFGLRMFFMARGSQQATQAANTANSFANSFGGNAGNVYGTLMPELSSEAANPTGFTQPQQAQMLTAAEGSAGGSQAGAVGEGALLSQRTRNPGMAAAAIGRSTRTAGEGLAKNALGVKIRSAELANENRQRALSGLGQLNATETGGANQSLGQVANNVNANTNAVNASYDWAKDVFNPLLQAAGGAGGAYMGGLASEGRLPG